MKTISLLAVLVVACGGTVQPEPVPLCNGINPNGITPCTDAGADDERRTCWDVIETAPPVTCACGAVPSPTCGLAMVLDDGGIQYTCCPNGCSLGRCQ